MISWTKRLLMSLAVAASACSDTYLESGERRAVVEGYLVADERIAVTITTESVFQTGDTTEYLDGLSLSIHEGENIYHLQGVGEGQYIADEGVAAVAGKTYALHFGYQEKELHSSAYIPAKPVDFLLSEEELTIVIPEPGVGPPSLPDPVIASWSNPDNAYHMVVVTCLEENPEEISSDGGPRMVGGGSFRNEPSTGTSYSIRQPSFKYYGMHAVVLFRLSPEYSTLYDDPGTSSLNLKSPYTNIVNGLGIFTGMNTDTLYLNVVKE